MNFPSSRSIVAGLAFGLLAACASDDMAESEKSWPKLADITVSPDLAASVDEPASVIRALREEAEMRKSEGYQAPVAPPQVAPAATPAPDPAPEPATAPATAPATGGD